MEKLLEEMNNKLSRMETSNTRIENKIDSLQMEIKTLKQDNEEVKEQNRKLTAIIKDQDQKIIQMEKEHRKKNIVIYGIKETDEENEAGQRKEVKSIVVEQMKTELDPAIDIVDTKRIGMKHSGKNRPLLVELRSYSKKLEIMNMKKSLKESDIFIDEDLPKEIQQKRKQLLPYMKKAREGGEKAYLNYDKLKIGNNLYTTEDLQTVEEEIKRKNADTSGPDEHKRKGRTMSERSPGQEMIRTKLFKQTSQTSNQQKN